MTKDELCEAALQELHCIEQGLVTVDMVAGDPSIGQPGIRKHPRSRMAVANRAKAGFVVLEAEAVWTAQIRWRWWR